jgi:F420-dependent oxidoreductase-like protein
MKLGLNLGFLTSANRDLVPRAVLAERLGYDSVWVAEAWGSDAVSLLAWIGAKTERISLGTAVLQIPSRTPALIAMTAATLDRLSEGRLLLGLGVSGPQVVEGWHGVEFGSPLKRTRECIDIVRDVLVRKAPLTYSGDVYRVPVENGTGLGKPLKLMISPARKRVPIYLAAIGPKNVALAAEIADGWLPIFYSPFHRDVFREFLDSGWKRGARGNEREDFGFDVAPSVNVGIGDHRLLVDQLRPELALYIGGMGARGRNFYNNLACRYGYEAEAAEIQDLFLEGKKKEAAAAVPEALVDEVALLGTPERIADRLRAFRDAGVTHLICVIRDQHTLEAMPELVARAS